MGLLLALAALAMAEPIHAKRLPPVELCTSEPGFEEFRSRLRKIVARKDESDLLALLSDDVEVNFGGDLGPALFAANWEFEGLGESHVWGELEDALSRGCAPTGDALMAPSLGMQFPEDLDPFDTWIARPGTVLRERPEDHAPIIAKLDWDLLAASDPNDDGWESVRLLDGRHGFVRHEQLVSPLDYRLVIERRDGKWLITAFVAGD